MFFRWSFNRSSGRTADAADATHLLSGGSPVLPGTSLAGALRSRALRIARLVRCTRRRRAMGGKGFGSRNSKENDTEYRFPAQFTPKTFFARVFFTRVGKPCNR